MHSLTLDFHNRATLAEALASPRWVVACLCAGWCSTCGTYRATFEQLAARHPDKLFVWIDIEDQADLVGELDVENFPTLLIQRQQVVAFFGTVLPDPVLAERLLQAQVTQTDIELASLAHSSAERRQWQAECNLQRLLGDSEGA
jgi:thioredoxin-like negative regulator of GroEL